MANLSLRQLAELTHGPVNGQPLVLLPSPRHNKAEAKL
jgi:hypothetical protein